MPTNQSIVGCQDGQVAGMPYSFNDCSTSAYSEIDRTRSRFDRNWQADNDQVKAHIHMTAYASEPEPIHFKLYEADSATSVRKH